MVLDKDASKEVDGMKTIDVTLSRQMFEKLFRHFKLKYHKSSERCIKQYVKNDLFYEIYFDRETFKYNEVKVYSKMIHETEVSGNIACCMCNKQKYQFHSFPSSSDIHSINYIKRNTVRLNNRIFINFDLVRTQQPSREFNKIFVNVNQDANSDLDFLKAELEPVIRDITMMTTSGN